MVPIYQNRLIVANKSEQTIRNYVRGLVKLYEFHHKSSKELELDQVICFLVFLKDDKGLNWKHDCLQIIKNAHRGILKTVSCN